MLLMLFLSLFVGLLLAIDPAERVGTCDTIRLNVSYYMNANEGVWFPQYRVRDEEYDINSYSCHTVYERVYVDDNSKPWLDSSSYYSKNGMAVKEGQKQVYFKTDERGKLNCSTYIPDEGNFQIFNYILNLTPEYRVRYVCSDFLNTNEGNYQIFNYILNLTSEYRVRYICSDFPNASVYAVYIETRELYPKMETIKKAQHDLHHHNISVPLVKINQKKCKRPINMNGYVPLVSVSESS